MATFYRTRAVLAVNAGASSSLLTYYWDSTGGTPTAVVTEAHARVRAFWNSFAAQIGSNSTLTINPVADEVEETNGQIVNQQVGTLPAAVVFTSAGEYLPMQTQALLKLGTSIFRDGRRVSGRQFIPGLTEPANTAGGQPLASVMTALGTAAALLGTTVVTPINQRVWSRPRAADATHSARSGLSVVVTSRTTGASWAVLKSRRV